MAPVVGPDLSDVCLSHALHSATGVLKKIRGGLHYFERFTKGSAKALDLIYASSSNHIRSHPFTSARQKVPLAIPVPHFSKVEKNLGVVVLLSDGRRRGSQKVVFVCFGQNEDAICLRQVWEKSNDRGTVSVGLLSNILRRPCCERGQQRG